MANPQQQLYQLLAEGARRGGDVDRIHKAAMQQIPQQHQATHAELGRLRDRIQAAGIGADPEAEERYMQLLRDRRKLEQLGAMNPVLTPVSTPADADLQKALDYGALLLDVYGGGVLVKSAAGDLSEHIAKLRSLGDDQADELAGSLEQLL
jgi:hypothetical protein